MDKFNIIFCVLTYKNTSDILDFIKNIREDYSVNFSYKIVIVNNYADEDSLNKIRKIAQLNDCDLIENENLGYGHGNNIGIGYIRENYIFDYLIVCNPDTEIIQFDYKSLQGHESDIVAPLIECKNGKRQNPMYFDYMPLSEKLVYKGLKKENRIFLTTGIALNKIHRSYKNIMMNLLKQKKKRIYACHGSYIIFSNIAINKLYPVFDDNIFLFCEENILARKAQTCDVQIIFNKDIKIFHKEDGSMSLINNKLSKIRKVSYLYYYERQGQI